MKIVARARQLRRSFFVLVFILACCSRASATSVRETSVAELTDRSAVIFEGIVVDVGARKTAHRTIVTDVVFEVMDVIKGRLPQKRLKLEFLGGTVAGERQSVSAMNYPELGERGIYFAEAIDRRLINPLYGWDQGRFLIQDGRVLTARHGVVVDVSSSDAVFFHAPSNAKPSSGVARGVMVRAAAASDRGMSSEQFKERLRNLLGGAR